MIFLAIPLQQAGAQETAPGDICTTGELNRIRTAGGPETTGVYRLLRCNGSIWTSIQLSDLDGTLFPWAISITGDISPPTISSNQNNYNPTGLSSASILRLSSDASRTISGLSGGTDGRILKLMNVGTFPVVLINQSTDSIAANRFAIGSNITLGADQTVALVYDLTSQRWRAGALPFDQAGVCIRPSICKSIGDICNDSNPATTNDPIFAGFLYDHDTQLCRRIYVTNQSQGTTNRWKITNGINDILVDSLYYGKANSDQLPNSTDYPAFKVCKDLSHGGFSDWYLPAREELNVLWRNRFAINANAVGSFSTFGYSSSSEFNANQVWSLGFNDGALYRDGKTVQYDTRCVRSD